MGPLRAADDGEGSESHPDGGGTPLASALVDSMQQEHQMDLSDGEHNAKILRVVFQRTEFDHDDDIEALCGALRLSLHQFSPTRHGEDEAGRMMVKVQPDDEAGACASTLDLVQAPARSCPGEDDAVRSQELMVKIKDLKFTHDSVASRFRDGSSFEGLMEDLRSGNVDPMRNLKPLKVYHWPGHGYYSRDNRRLQCLKEFQREIGNRELFVRIVAMELPASTMERLHRNPKVWRMLRDFLPACTTRNDGQSVAVRR